ncbi:hypothetical protein [Campylobacter showae]|jgi:hypothetical protein|uniref:hypothetical protein n=1 Tax=Campylobacter showae TaxID=204 RepID=UPI000F07FFF1|nr:hypothetical protein [Campylobacter showae]
MANIDCEQAFRQEMDVLNAISLNVKTIGDKVSENNPVDTKTTLDAISLKLSENQTELKETNRLLKFLCENLLGKSE